MVADKSYAMNAISNILQYGIGPQATNWKKSVNGGLCSLR